MDVISKRVTKVGRMFAGKGARKATAHEKVMRGQISKWINKYLISLKDQWLRENLIVRKSGYLIVRKAEYAATPEELMKILEKWYMRSYRSNYKDETNVIIRGEEYTEELRRSQYRTTLAANYIISDLRREFYDSTRKYIATLREAEIKYGIKASDDYIRRGLEGVPGPDPFTRAGVRKPPPFKFRGRKLRTFGDNGVNGSRDPYGVANRARMIARTELTQARNDAAFRSYKDRGTKYKMWLAFHDSRTRETHRDLDGVVIPVDDYFIWESENGTTLAALAPGDGILPPGERINCRCRLAPASERDYKKQGEVEHGEY